MTFQKGNKYGYISKGMLGKKHSINTRTKMSIAKKGKIPKNLSQLLLRDIRGSKNPMSRYNRPRELCWNWKGGITRVSMVIRGSFQYRQWKSDVFTRDEYTCQDCGNRHCNFEAHHIKLFSIIIQENNIKTFEDALCCEELWNINNGKTLCRKCHDKTKKRYGKTK